MTWRSLALAAFVALAACQKPNLDSTGGGYGAKPATAGAATAEAAADTTP
jgi:hypothetical protein